MGKRRIRCLKRLGIEEIVGDARQDRSEQARSTYGIEVVVDWLEAKSRSVDAWIIATPPDTHVAYGLRAVDRGILFFTEANVTDPRTGELIHRLEKSKIVGAPSRTMRYYAGPRRINEILASEVI